VRRAVALALLALAVGATSSAAAPVQLRLSYTVPPRFSPVTPTAAAVSPRTWSVRVTVRWPDGRPCTGTYAWTVDGRPARFVKRSCSFTLAGFPQLDHPYRVGVTASRSGRQAGGRTTVTIRDRLIVGLGDSIASGEGNPDHGITSVRWLDRRCHRSANGFEALVARQLEAASDTSSVTYVPLACSGASIPTGLLGPYAGIEPVGGTMVPAQLDAMRSLLGARKPDAVLVSVGINDLGFGNVAFFCFDDGVDRAAAAKVDCWRKPYPNPSSPATLQQFVRARAAALPGRYARLAAAFESAGIPASSVYMTEYPDATRNANGATCDPLIPYLDSRPFGYTLRGMITRDEAAQAESDLVQPANDALRAAAARYGWHLVSGVAAQSEPHGLCAGDTWFVSVLQSLVEQHDAFGTLHPNAKGQRATAALVAAALR
jgi:lysophospholipase L1-like esterase